MSYLTHTVTDLGELQSKSRSSSRTSIMICQQCLHRAATGAPSSAASFWGTWRSGRARSSVVFRRRPFSGSTLSQQQQAISATTVAQAKGRQDGDKVNPGPATATSTSAAQPFSTPLTPSPQAASVRVGGGSKRSRKGMRSSVPAGQPLRGINYMKNQSDPLALPDAEYPAWLWTCLEPKDGAAGQAGANEAGTLLCSVSGSELVDSIVLQAIKCP